MLRACRTRLKSLIHYFNQRPKLRAAILCFTILVVMGAIFLHVSPVHAQNKGGSDALNQLTVSNFFSIDGWKKILSGLMLDIASLFIRVALFFLTFIIEIAAYNGYLDATAVTVGWVMVRDLTNMFFVIVMLLIAFGTILGIEQYEWKKLLIKFVLAAVFVNFSRLICGVFIDISQIVMQTFVNGIVATAGGNLINMFNLDSIMSFSSTQPSALDPGFFTASVAAVTFAGMTMMVLGIFIFMLVARVIRLWILIVLSPLAFVLSVIPLTQKFAGQWWSEMGDDLVTGPVLLFFIWLSFVSLGSGDVNERQIAPASEIPAAEKQSLGAEADQVAGGSAGISKAMSWNKMANFAIAIGMLAAGARVASTIGSSSGSALTKVTDFGKKVATIASGVAAGQWLHERGVHKGAAIGLAKVAGRVTGVTSRVKRIKNWAERQKEGFRAWVLDTGMRPKQQYNAETGRMEYVYNKETGQVEMEQGKRGLLHPMRWWLNRRALADIRSEKVLDKTKKFADVRADLARARIRGVPTAFFQRGDEKIDALDRIEQGMLEGEKARSADKTKEFGALGRQMVTAAPRMQFRKDEGEWFAQWHTNEDKGTLADERAAHQVKAQRNEQNEKKLMSEALERFAGKEEGKKVVEAKVAAELKVKAAESKFKAIELAQKTGLFDLTQREALQKQLALARSRGDSKGVEAIEAQLERMADAEKALTRTTEAGRAAHTEEALMKSIEKTAERKYLETEHGTEELAEEAAIGAITATEEARVKEKEAKYKAAYAKDEQGAALIKALKQAELDKSLHDAVIKRVEGEQRTGVMTAAAAPGGTLQQIQEEEIRAKTEDAHKKKLEEEAKAAYVNTTKGADVVKALADYEVGGKIGEDFLNKIKNAQWEEQYAKAREKMREEGAKIEKEADPEKREQALAALANGDAYIQALKVSQESAFRTTMANMQKSEAESKAKAAYVENDIIGLGTPSTAYDQLAESMLKAMDKLDEPGRGNFAAENVANFAYLLERDKAEKAAGRAGLTEAHKVALYGVMKNLVAQGNVDDGGGAIANAFARLDRGELDNNPAEKAKVEAMKRLFGPGQMFDIGIKQVLDKELKVEGGMVKGANGQVIQHNGTDLTEANFNQLRLSERNRLINEHGVEKKYLASKGPILDAQGNVVKTRAEFEAMSKDEKEQLRQQHGQTRLTYQYHGNARTVNRFQNWALSGGDNQLLQTHQDVEDYMEKTGIDDYETAAKQWFKQVYASANDAFKAQRVASLEEMKTKFQRISTKLLEGAEGFKKDAFTTAHTENAGHQVSDINFGVRFSTVRESKDVVEANDRKRKGGTNKNYHSDGTVNYQTGVMEEVDARMNASSFGSAKRYQDNAQVLDRTVDGHSAYAPSQTKEMYTDTAGEQARIAQFVKRHVDEEIAKLQEELQKAGLRELVGPELDDKREEFAEQVRGQFKNAGYLGGRDLETIVKRFGSATDMIGKVIIPQLIGSMESANNQWAKKLGNTEALHAQDGFQDIMIVGDTAEQTIASKHLSEMVSQILDKYKNEMGRFADVLRNQGYRSDKTGELITKDELVELLTQRRNQAQAMREQSKKRPAGDVERQRAVEQEMSPD